MVKQYQISLIAKNSSGPIQQQTYDGDELLAVQEFVTQVPVRVCARDLSPYRHTLLLDGTEFRILNVIRMP
jgi:hypothetical protein